MPSELLRVLENHRDDVLRLFLARAPRDAVARPPEGTTRSELLDHLPRFLDGVATALGEELERGDGRAVEQRLSAAAIHGVQRLRLGFDLEAVVREYGVLRECVLEVADAVGVRVTLHEAMILARRIDAGTAEAVAEFVREKHAALARAVLAREEAIAVVSHDLRTPLHVIQLAGRRLATLAEPDSRGRELADSVVRGSEELHRMVQDLLDMAAIDAGRFASQPTEADAHDLVQLAAPPFESRARDAGITLDLEPPARGLTVCCDPAHVGRVLANLVDNAIKYTPKGGVVRVTACATADAVRFEVTDTGTGVAPEYLPHVFQRFWRAPDSDRRGTGLGLHIARGLVESNGGQIGVDSEPGKGSTFWFILPLPRRGVAC